MRYLKVPIDIINDDGDYRAKLVNDNNDVRTYGAGYTKEEAIRDLIRQTRFEEIGEYHGDYYIDLAVYSVLSQYIPELTNEYCNNIARQVVNRLHEYEMENEITEENNQ